MTAPRYRLSPETEADVDEIIQYLARTSPAGARTVYGALVDAFQQLAEYPGIGHARRDLTERPLKFWGVYSYLIVYDPDASPIQIVAVLHEARDVEALMKER